jgi:hypothetical protein
MVNSMRLDALATGKSCSMCEDSHTANPQRLRRVS